MDQEFEPLTCHLSSTSVTPSYCHTVLLPNLAVFRSNLVAFRPNLAELELVVIDFRACRHQPPSLLPLCPKIARARAGPETLGGGKGHRSALSLDSSFGNLSMTPQTETGRSSTASNRDDADVQIIGYDRIPGKPDTDIRAAAQGVFDKVLESGTYYQVEDTLVYGNPKGHSLLEDHEALRAEIARAAAQRGRMTQDLAEMKQGWAETNQRLTGTERDLAVWKARSTALEARQGVQGRAIEGYLMIRNRFIDTFRRDIVSTRNAQGRQNIEAGNIAAHDGDAVTDATLFTSGDRTDVFVFHKLYGTSAEQVLELDKARDQDSISVLNAHASIISTKGKQIHEDISSAFMNFLDALAESQGERPQQNPSSDLTQAYNQFWDAHSKHS
ncbi:MAG: hypothetical protein M1840_001688 [Geoglossum simile]|nr:MAG: hypothetical protein M1840_001688 [Geoglossum simile]